MYLNHMIGIYQSVLLLLTSVSFTQENKERETCSLVLTYKASKQHTHNTIFRWNF